MKVVIVRILLVLTCFGQNFTIAQEVKIKDTEQRKLYSEIVNTEYSINLFLPRGYDKSSKSYPVVFISDAEYNFGMVSYAARRLIKDKLIPELVLVGIAYDTSYTAYTNFRQRDYTPTKTRLPNTGGGDNFLNFIEKELIPFLGKEYRITEDRTFCGHSLGGLIGFHALFTKQELFSRYLLVSPSLWYDNKEIINAAKRFFSEGNAIHSKVYAAIGELETTEKGLTHEMVDDLNRFVDLLNSKTETKFQIKKEILDNETHRSVFPRAFTNGMRVLFEKK